MEFYYLMTAPSKTTSTTLLRKKQNGHFFTFIKPRPHEKNQKNLMRQFENMSKKTLILGYFGQKWPILDQFGPKKGQFWISGQKAKLSLFSVTESQVHDKNQKNLIRGFLRKSVRTDGRTDKRESIGLRDSLRPKTYLKYFVYDFSLGALDMKMILSHWKNTSAKNRKAAQETTTLR